MDDEDEQTPLLDEVDEVVEEKSSRQENEHPGESLPSLKSALKKSRWNVFLFLGVAFVMFGFALFPMTMNAKKTLNQTENFIDKNQDLPKLCKKSLIENADHLKRRIPILDKQEN